MAVQSVPLITSTWDAQITLYFLGCCLKCWPIAIYKRTCWWVQSQQ